MIGERFGSFKAVARLGEGGVGEVFLAEHQHIQRRVAIKVLMRELTQDPDTVRRFFIEARATSLIRHPGIIEIFDCDVHRNGRAYIVMEFLEGETVGKRIDRDGNLSWSYACHLAHLVADAIGAAHEKGIVHRDLKPENVFLLSGQRSPPVELKVLDFGLAKLLGGDSAGGKATLAGSVIGSPTYMSPEQCNGGPVDHRSDVYSLGCMLFEMIAGNPPFGGSRMRDLLTAHRFQAPPPLAAFAPEVPTWLARLVARMLSKAPVDRPQSMREIVRVLAGPGTPGLLARSTAG
jgi:serine/threonine protein kinase